MTDEAGDRRVDDLLPVAVSDYARRLHGVLGDRHHIASPLGAWLVLALVGAAVSEGAAAEGSEADAIGAVLGMPVADAARAARRLLDNPHPQVAAAAAVWTGTVPARAVAWVAGLPAPVTHGPVPRQAGADAWARKHTFGLIEKFPLELDPPPLAVVSSAFATRISWSSPFELADASQFRSAWRDRVSTVLKTPPKGHRCTIIGHPELGDVAVHRAFAEGLTVTSVIAAPDFPAAQVLAAAHDIVRDERAERMPRRSLFDLPLGDGPAWTVTESPGIDRDETFCAVLPAWSASDRHDLTLPGTGFEDAAPTLMRLFGGGRWDAAQAATARYHRRGFEAAAVTAFGVALSFGSTTPGPHREAMLRFDRPFAVVAATDTGQPGPWRGLPVFSAWITEPGDAADT